MDKQIFAENFKKQVQEHYRFVPFVRETYSDQEQEDEQHDQSVDFEEQLNAMLDG